MLANGETATVQKITVEHLDEPQTTYNIEVEGAHTYCVGKDGVLVHNACKPNIGTEVPDGYSPTYENGTFDPSYTKHGMVQRGNVSARISSTEYGQYALDKSLAAGSSRMSFNGKDFLVFRSSGSPGLWHGYATNYAGLIGRTAQISVANNIFNVWR